MMKKIVLGVALVALVVALAPTASAACNPSKSAYTYNSGTGGFVYWGTPSGQTGQLVGQFWQLGAPTSANTGNCQTVDGLPVGLYFAASGTGIGLHFDLGDCGTGCVGGTLAYLAQKQRSDGTGSEFLLATVAETPAAAVNFDYSTSPGNLIPIPRPRVTSSSRSGNLVNLTVAVDPVASGAIGPNSANEITGYNILSKQAAADPGRNASSFTQLAAVSAPGGSAGTVSTSVDCTNTAQDQWIVTQLSFENGQVVSGTVSGATRINCNPTLADPHFKIIQKPLGPQKQVPNPNN